MDAVEILKKCRPLIRYVHFKDLDENGNWASMGEGIVDFPQIVKYLEDTEYDGWIIVEEESQEAVDDPDRVTLRNGVYMRRFQKRRDALEQDFHPLRNYSHPD